MSSMNPVTPESSTTVQQQDVAMQIQSLQQMRREATFWRYGALAIIALTVLYSITALLNSAYALIQPGPGQTEFTTKLTEGLQADVFPNVQQIATQTLTEMRPEVMDSFQKLNGRTPEVAQASLDQLKQLQENLPARSEKVLDETFSAELKKREGKIKEMFPDVTEEKLQTLVTNLTAAGQKRMPEIADQLIGKHVVAVNGIVANINTIHEQEKIPANSETATWEMSLAILDLIRDDLREMAPAEAKEAAPKGAAMATDKKAMVPSEVKK